MQTREQRIFLHWKSIKKHYDYRHGEWGSPLMQVARHWSIPIREVLVIIASERERRANLRTSKTTKKRKETKADG